MTRFVFFGLLWALMAGPAYGESHQPSTVSRGFPISFGGPFSLIDHLGRPRTDRDFQGRFLLVTFGYTACPDICPTGLRTMGQALDLVGAKAGNVQPLFISVDPDRDRPDALKRYVANFHPRLVGLTGTPSQVRAVARAYRIQRGKVALPDTAEEKYLILHTPTTFLMGPDGTLVTLFPYDTKADAMAGVLRRYLSETRS
jgi:protein SCO1/2